ncbi:MAG: GNAT family N-acetyltransferase [Stellaceae bacterium]
MTIPGNISLAWRDWAGLSTDELYQLLAFRQAIFVVEQASAYPDLDGRDSTARHLTLRRDEALIGYLRLTTPEGEGEIRSPVRLGRVAVAEAERGKGYARSMVAEALRLAVALHPGRGIEIGAQVYLEPFYARFGFVRSTSPYDDFGIPHIDMVRAAEGLARTPSSPNCHAREDGNP